MLDKVSCYPPEWVYKVLGRSSTALNNALVSYSTALLLAIEENEREFADKRFWELAECLQTLAMRSDIGPDVQQEIAARLYDRATFDVLNRGLAPLFNSWINSIRKMSVIRAYALLAVVNTLNCMDGPELEWWTKEAFLVRKGILQKSS